MKYESCKESLLHWTTLKLHKFSMMKDGISNIGKQAIALEKIFKGEIITIQNV